MKRNLVIWGSSIKNVFVKCAVCGKTFSWLKAEETSKVGVYRAVCYSCWRKEKVDH